MRTVGYRQIRLYLTGEVNYSEMVARAQAATRQLAKRQLTWLRGYSELTWLDSRAAGLEAQAINALSGRLNG